MTGAVLSFGDSSGGSRTGNTSVEMVLPAAVVEAIAERAAELVLERMPAAPSSSPYLSVPEAAEYARCSRQRIYDLVSSRQLTRFKDGSRVLVSRDELDARFRGVALQLPQAGRGRVRAGVAG